MAAGIISQSRVEPSMSVKRNVTVPDGPSMYCSFPRPVAGRSGEPRSTPDLSSFPRAGSDVEHHQTHLRAGSPTEGRTCLAFRAPQSRFLIPFPQLALHPGFFISRPL